MLSQSPRPVFKRVFPATEASSVLMWLKVPVHDDWEYLGGFPFFSLEIGSFKRGEGKSTGGKIYFRVKIEFLSCSSSAVSQKAPETNPQGNVPSLTSSKTIYLLRGGKGGTARNV